MNSRKKIIVLSVMGIALAFGVKEGIRKYPDIKSGFLEQKRRDEIYNLSGVDDAGENFHARIDTLMAFVHNNSEHNIDDEFWSDFRNKPRTLDKFLAYARGQSDDPPNMKCSTRSKLLLPLLEKAGYEARMIDMFKYKSGYNSHVVVEVKNDRTKKWELYDPTYQIYWKNSGTGERASLRDLVFSGDFTFTPCHDKDRCGYNRADHGYPPPEDVRDFFGLAIVMDEDSQGEKMLLNIGRFDLDTPPAGGGESFCEWGRERWCPKNREIGVFRQSLNQP